MAQPIENENSPRPKEEQAPEDEKLPRNLRRIGNRLRLGLGRKRIASQNLDDCLCAVENAGVEVAAAERRQNGLFDDDSALRVGERAFEAVTNLDANLVFLGRDDEQRSRVGALLPDALMAAELIAEVLDRETLQ